MLPITVSATHVATGRTTVFVDGAGGQLGRWGRDPGMQPRPARLRAEHALASAAIPIMFPAVRVDGELYCDTSRSRRRGASERRASSW